MMRARAVAVASVALAMSLALTGCLPFIPSPNPVPDTDQGNTVNATGFSTLTPEGIAEIKSSNTASFDLSDGQLTLEDVGLEPGTPPSDVVAESGKISLEIVGSGGTLTAESDHLRFLAADGENINPITYFLTTEDDDEFFAMIREGVERYGIDSTVAEEWISSRAIDSDPASDFALPLGTALGFNVSYDLNYDPSTPVQVIIVQVYPL